MATFLRNLPLAMEREQRMRIEAIGYAVDLIEIATERLHESAKHFACDAPALDDPLLTRAMFLDAWSITDNSHNLRKLLDLGFKRAGKTSENANEVVVNFLTMAEQATFLRNRMDHFSSQLGNLAGRKSADCLYGGLSWVWVTHLTGGVPSHARCNLLIAGGFHRDKEQAQFSNPLSAGLLRLPIGMFSLSAFDHHVNLSKLSEQSALVANYYNDVVATRFDEGLLKFAAENGLEVDKLRTTTAACPWMCLAVTMGDFPAVPSDEAIHSNAIFD